MIYGGGLFTLRRSHTVPGRRNTPKSATQRTLLSSAAKKKGHRRERWSFEERVREIHIFIASKVRAKGERRAEKKAKKLLFSF